MFAGNKMCIEQYFRLFIGQWGTIKSAAESISFDFQTDPNYF
jgi:hypothetical protein